ncbi:MAG: CNNM domain-containing protein, partial [Bacteroidales bacterium]|nr:CNNM domain-containing protein [Bacteroidales bacterium]
MGTLLAYLFASLVISFICSILESVLMSTPISYVTMKEEEGDKRAILFKKYKQEPDRPLAAILSLNTIANTVGAAGVGQQASIYFGNEWFGLVSGLMTLMILIFSEIIPKTIGTSYWKRLMGQAALTIKCLVFIMYPLVLLIKLISKWFTPKSTEKTVSREEVSAMVNVGEEEGVFEEGENKIIQNLIRLDSIKACDAMTPRVVAAVASEKMTLKQFYKDDTFLHHSRIPVYAESTEFISGYILRSDALQLLADDKFEVTLGSIKRNIPYFNEETSLGDIWDQFKDTNEQISVIIDEYGSFQGILTLEDILETILGLEIVDEKDEVSDLQQFARE